MPLLLDGVKLRLLCPTERRSQSASPEGNHLNLVLPNVLLPSGAFTLTNRGWSEHWAASDVFQIVTLRRTDNAEVRSSILVGQICDYAAPPVQGLDVWADRENSRAGHYIWDDV